MMSRRRKHPQAGEPRVPYDSAVIRPAKALYLRRRNLYISIAFPLLCFTLIASPLHAAKSPVVRIIVVNSQPEAEGLLAEIDKGRPFASLAKEKSIDEKTRDRYGEVEAAAFEGLDRPLKEAALQLGEGEVSKVISLGDKRHALLLVVDLAHYRKGAKAFRAGDFKTAEINLLKHVELNPDAVKARVFLGRIYEAANETKKAEGSYRDALRFDPGCEEAYLRLGALYLAAGEFLQAKDLYSEGLNHLPDSKSLKAGMEKTKKRSSTARVESPKKDASGSEPRGDSVSDVKASTPPAKVPSPEEGTPLVKKTESTKEKSVAAGAASSSKATSVSRIELAKSAEGLKLLITGNGAMSPNVFPIDEKVVIDIPNVSMRALLPSVVSPLKGIRAGQHKDKMRLVLTLKEKTAFEVSASGSTVEVLLKTREPQAAQETVAMSRKETAADRPSPKETAPKEAPVENPKGKTALAAKGPKSEPPAVGTSKTADEKKMHIRIIFLDKESDALDVLSQLKKGRPFALLAKERSVDEKTRETYGYLGEIGVDSLHTSIQDALSKLKEGQTSDVIKMGQNRYAIVQVTHMGLYREGEKAFIAGDFPTAEKKLLKYVETNPDAVKARTMLGKIYETKKEPSKAIEMYKEAISYSPKTVVIYERLARVYLLLGMYLKAKEVYIQGLIQVPSSPALEEGVEMADMLLIGFGERMP